MDEYQKRIRRHEHLLIANILVSIPVALVILLWLWFSVAASDLPPTSQGGMIFPAFVLAAITPCVFPCSIAQIITSILLLRNPLSQKRDKTIAIFTLIISGLVIVPFIILTAQMIISYLMFSL